MTLIGNQAPTHIDPYQTDDPRYGLRGTYEPRSPLEVEKLYNRSEATFLGDMARSAGTFAVNTASGLASIAEAPVGLLGDVFGVGEGARMPFQYFQTLSDKAVYEMYVKSGLGDLRASTDFFSLPYIASRGTNSILSILSIIYGGGLLAKGGRAMGLLAKGTKVTKLPYFATAGIMEAGPVMKDVREELRVKYPDMSNSEIDAWTSSAGLATGIISGYLESLFPEKLISNEFLSKAIYDKLIVKMGSYGTNVINWGSGVALEAVTESLQEFAAAVTTAAGSNRGDLEKAFDSIEWKLLGQAMFEAGAASFWGTSVMGAGRTLMGNQALMEDVAKAVSDTANEEVVNNPQLDQDVDVEQVRKKGGLYEDSADYYNSATYFQDAQRRDEGIHARDPFWKNPNWDAIAEGIIRKGEVQQVDILFPDAADVSSAFMLKDRTVLRPMPREEGSPIQPGQVYQVYSMVEKTTQDGNVVTEPALRGEFSITQEGAEAQAVQSMEELLEMSEVFTEYELEEYRNRVSNLLVLRNNNVPRRMFYNILSHIGMDNLVIHDNKKQEVGIDLDNVNDYATFMVDLFRQIEEKKMTYEEVEGLIKDKYGNDVGVVEALLNVLEENTYRHQEDISGDFLRTRSSVKHELSQPDERKAFDATVNLLQNTDQFRESDAAISGITFSSDLDANMLTLRKQARTSEGVVSLNTVLTGTFSTLIHLYEQLIGIHEVKHGKDLSSLPPSKVTIKQVQDIIRPILNTYKTLIEQGVLVPVNKEGVELYQTEGVSVFFNTVIPSTEAFLDTLKDISKKTADHMSRLLYAPHPVGSEAYPNIKSNLVNPLLNEISEYFNNILGTDKVRVNWRRYEQLKTGKQDVDVRQKLIDQPTKQSDFVIFEPIDQEVSERFARKSLYERNDFVKKYIHEFEKFFEELFGFDMVDAQEYIDFLMGRLGTETDIRNIQNVLTTARNKLLETVEMYIRIADILNIPIRMMSLGGKVSLRLGSTNETTAGQFVTYLNNLSFGQIVRDRQQLISEHRQSPYADTTRRQFTWGKIITDIETSYTLPLSLFSHEWMHALRAHLRDFRTRVSTIEKMEKITNDIYKNETASKALVELTKENRSDYYIRRTEVLSRAMESYILLKEIKRIKDGGDSVLLTGTNDSLLLPIFYNVYHRRNPQIQAHLTKILEKLYTSQELREQGGIDTTNPENVGRYFDRFKKNFHKLSIEDIYTFFLWRKHSLTYTETQQANVEKNFDNLFTSLKIEPVLGTTDKFNFYSLQTEEQIKQNNETALEDAEVKAVLEGVLGKFMKAQKIEFQRVDPDKVEVPVKYPSEAVDGAKEAIRTGLWSKALNIVAVATGFGAESALHEGLHIVIDHAKSLLTPQQYLFMINNKAFRDKNNNFNPEMVTYKFQQWLKQKNYTLKRNKDGTYTVHTKGPKNAFDSIFKPILDFFVRLKNVLAGRGFITTDDFFMQFLTGEFGKNFEQQRAMGFQYSKPGSVEAEINNQMQGLKSKDAWRRILHHLGVEESFNQLGGFFKTGRSVVTENDMGKLEINKARNMLKYVADLLKSHDGEAFRKEMAVVYWIAEKRQNAKKILEDMDIPKERHRDFQEAANEIRNFFAVRENDLIKRGILKANYGKHVRNRLRLQLLKKFDPTLEEGNPDRIELAQTLLGEYLASEGSSKRREAVLQRIANQYDAMDRDLIPSRLDKAVHSIFEKMADDKLDYNYVHLPHDITHIPRKDFLTKHAKDSMDWLMQQESDMRTQDGERVPLLKLSDVNAIEGIISYAALYAKAIAQDRTFNTMVKEGLIIGKEYNMSESGRGQWVIPERLKGHYVDAFSIFNNIKAQSYIIRKDAAQLYKATQSDDYVNNFQRTLSLIKMLQFIKPHILPMYDFLQSFFAGTFMTKESALAAAVGGAAGLTLGPVAGVLGASGGMIIANKHMRKAFRDYSTFSKDWQKAMELGRDSTVQHDPLNRMITQTQHEIGTRKGGPYGMIGTAAGGYIGGLTGLAIGGPLAPIIGIGLGGVSAGIAFKQFDYLMSNLTNLLGDFISPFTEDFSAHNIKKSAQAAWGMTIGTIYNYSFETAWTLDSIIRQATYNGLVEKGFSPEESAHMAAQFHGHYSNVPVKTRRFLNPLIFTPTFKIAMGNTYTRMLMGPINAMKQGREGPEFKKNMLFTWGAVRLASVVAGMDIFMTSMMGFERDEFGRRYRRLVETKKGNRELTVTLANPANLMLKYMHIGKRVTSPFSDNVWASAFRELSYDVHPAYRLALESLNMSIAPTYDVLEDGKYKFYKGVTHFLRGSIALFDTIAGPKTSLEDQEIMVRELTNFSDLWLGGFGFMYLRRDTRDRVEGRISSIQRNLSASMRKAVERGASEGEKDRLRRSAEGMISDLEDMLRELEDKRQ